MKTPAQQARYAVPGLERGLRILQRFDREQTRLTAPEMAKALRIPRSTVFRLLQTLERLGFLEREDKAYRLGPAVLRLGFEYLASLEITDLGRPSVEALRDDTGFSAQLVIRDGREVVVVLKAAASSAFASSVNVGTRFPAHATTLGRVLMCDLAERDLRDIFPEPKLASFSSNTPRTVSELAALLREDRARGYTVSEAFFEQSVSAIAAPIRDNGGRIVAAIGVTLQQSSIEPKVLRERLIKRVLRGAAEISHRLNYRPVAAAA